MSHVTTKPRRRTRKPVVLAKVIPFVRPVSLAARLDAAKLVLWKLVDEPRDVALLPEYRRRYEAARAEINAAHVAADARGVQLVISDGSPSGAKEIDQAEAWLRLLEREARTAVVIDLGAYRRARRAS